jgi:O-antigen/teichoic acid export membrane protein
MAAFFIAWSKPILRLALGAKFLPALPAMQLLGLGLVPFFLSTLFQYLFAALDEQRRFLFSTCLGSALRILLLVMLIPRFGFAGPALAFVCAETVIVGIWMFQLKRLGFPANLGNVVWRPLAAGSAMTLVLFAAGQAPLVWQIPAAVASLIVYAAVLLALKTFSVEEIHHAREGIAFVSPFIESWTKKFKSNT